ncbi:hypothetical protein [Gandjariella thermophila]|uniref:hypothetical protein n=1 Tax=Gandjariella thermophila TaxID=1931992 RepID=UPI0010F653E3|nr:hypothetical protein [Gandjariella thermophila]
MTSAVRNALTLAGCLALLGVGCAVALSALESYSAPPTRTARVAVRVEAWTSSAVMRVRTLSTVRVGGLSGTDVPSGTPLDVVSATLAGADAVPPHPQVGSVLGCDVRIRRNPQGETVVDLANCVPSTTTNPRS